MHVPDALAVAVVERLELPVGQDGLEGRAVSGQEIVADLVVLGLAPPWIVEPERDLGAQRVGDLEVATEEALGLGAAADRDEVEELDEEPGPAAASLTHRLDQRAEPGHE